MSPSTNASRADIMNKQLRYQNMRHARDGLLFATSALVSVFLATSPVRAADPAWLSVDGANASELADGMTPPPARAAGVAGWLVDSPDASQLTEGMETQCVGPACHSFIRGKMIDNAGTRSQRVGSNVEQDTIYDQPGIPFMISVDGQIVDESGNITDSGVFGSDPGARNVDRQRKADVDLSAVDIQVKFDGLDQTPLLNVSTVPVRRTYAAGEPVSFLATTNYPAFIERAEIRIFREGDNPSRRPVDIVPAMLNGETGWIMPAGYGSDYSYTLRVYDSKGRFDETIPLSLARTGQEIAAESRGAVAPGMAEDRTAIRNIPVHGGAVTVYGRNVPEGYSIAAFNEFMPIDPNGAFVAQRILPPGDHVVDVAIDGPMKAGALYFSRDINIPANEWFYVGLADYTVGKRTGDEGIEGVRPGEYDEVYQKGRLAFYLRGKIKGRFLLTAAADTGEDDIKNLFRNLDEKDAKKLLRKIDPDKYYPVYGDDSTSVEDAPTKGKFYVRLERGDSHVMWGNYKTHVTGTRFLASSRGLYGANAVLRSQNTTSFGERKGEVTAYAALPDTLPQRDEFLATGGSAYFLKRQDITIGSETVTIETRDHVTGRLVERRALVHGEDYTIDYLQGVIILKRPLSSTSAGMGPVRDGALGENKVYLVTQYEYVPDAGDMDGYIYGGRAQRWIGDRVRVGVTGMSEETGDADQQALGADIVVRRSETTYFEAEVARSSGSGFGTSRSVDGGLTITDDPKAGMADRSAMAWMVGAQMDLADFQRVGIPGVIGGYFERKEAGFTSITEQVRTDQRSWGLHMDVPMTGAVDLEVSYDDFKDGDGKKKRDGEVALSWQYDAYWKVAFGVSYSDLYSPGAVSSGKKGYNGRRMDAGVRVDYRQDEDYLYYGFAQTTFDRKGDIEKNDRVGVGAEVLLTEKVGAKGEVSYGTRGLGGLAAITYDPTVEDHYYIGYRLDPDRAFDISRSDALYGVDRGAIVGGLRRRLNEVTSAYSETNYDLFGRKRSLAQTYGVVYTPDPLWTVDAGFEAGQVKDDSIDSLTGLERTDFDRYSGSLAVAYKDDDLGLSARIRGEARFERSEDDSRNRNTYVLATGGTWSHDESGRVLANVDAVLSESDEGIVNDGDYVEASMGYAYRPAYHDRLNALLRYTFLYDLPGNDQISSMTGSSGGPLQRSHIVSADLTYDLLPWLSVGGKYGARFGEVRYRMSGSGGGFGEWEDSAAHLGIVRADLHIVKNWDALVEGRAFYTPTIKSADYGFLAALYRHVGNNFKVGAGYNFGRFSDDLRDLTLDDKGPFLNVVGKF
ncbi:hypothetical protein NTH_03448 [Nitratireductor thuwali]|uniref:TonB-dependent receptor n=2 Tax=Nitratireductor thuwali TaxID=2267699 RepID=A0ABY5MNG3_9HYPH|nr:hypothetical protein NTH_03448 [Nitratireductor thuwali]